MEQDQKKKYIGALAGSIALVVGPRDEDYNKGGIGLRDYWEMNGIRSPLQLVDMKLKRARSQIATWSTETDNKPIPINREQVEKLTESMFDLINYAAFVICEAESLADHNNLPHTDPRHHSSRTMTVDSTIGDLCRRLEETIRAWQISRTSV